MLFHRATVGAGASNLPPVTQGATGMQSGFRCTARVGAVLIFASQTVSGDTMTPSLAVAVHEARSRAPKFPITRQPARGLAGTV